jgi:hypothetical protein
MPKRTDAMISTSSSGSGSGNGRCKYIYVYRDGKDACTSFFHHLSNQADSGPFEGNFDDFVSDWLQNKIFFGGWAAHLKSWIPAAAESKNDILLVNYEDMLTDIEASVRRISAFLGRNTDSDFLRSNILPLISIEYMREHRSQYDPVSVAWKEGFQFIRKGVAGDFKNLFTAAHEAAYDDMIRKEFPHGYGAFLEQAADISSKKVVP